VGEVVGVGVGKADQADCVETHETSTLEADASEYKWSCAGIGLIYAESGGETEALVGSTGLE
jgi:hypothetical protein